MAAEKQEEGNGSSSARPAQGEQSGGSAELEQAGRILDGLRSAVDKASQTLHDFTQVSEKWDTRAREMAKEVRSQGEQAVGTVSRQVEQNPLTSLAIAFALGFLMATVTRR